MALTEKFISHIVLKYLVVPKSPVVIQEKKHIACIGDSITYGAGVNGKTNQTWEYFLNEIIGDDYQVINYGISGRTLQNEGDYPYKKDKFYKESLECKAETYIIMLGTNDAKPYNWNENRYKDQLDCFCREYINLANHPQVILMTPPQCYVDPKIGKVGFDIEEETIDNHIVDIVNNGLHIIDLHQYTQNHEDWFVDGVHPNELGNQESAKYIAINLPKEYALEKS